MDFSPQGSDSIPLRKFIKAYLIAQMVKNLPAMQETWVRSLVQKDPLGEGNGTFPLQYSCLENSMDRPWGQKELNVIEQLTQEAYFIREFSPLLSIHAIARWDN